MFYVSTPPGSVRNMCDRVLVLEKGRLGFDGDVDEGITYLQYDDDDEELGSRATTASAPTRNLVPPLRRQQARRLRAAAALPPYARRCHAAPRLDPARPGRPVRLVVSSSFRRAYHQLEQTLRCRRVDWKLHDCSYSRNSSGDSCDWCESCVSCDLPRALE